MLAWYIFTDCCFSVIPLKEVIKSLRLQSEQTIPSGTTYQHHRSPVAASPEQLGKLRSELDVVNVNVTLLRELLGNLTPNHEEPEDYSLMQALYTTCKEMQKRVLELIPVITNEEVTYELLSVNDEFNSVFEKYQRYMTHRGSTAEQQAAGSSASAREMAGADLIDFNNPPPSKEANQELGQPVASMRM